MPWCGPRRFRYRQRKQPKTSIFRNPCVVFIITFVTLASINLFHVPAKSKKAATRIIQRAASKSNNSKHHHHFFNSTAARPMPIHYSLLSEGVENRRKFQKYHAINSKNESVSMIQWANAVTQANKDSDSIIDELNAIIAAAPFGAVFFETRPFLPNSEDSPMEFVLVDAPDLDRAATNHVDTSTFADAIQASRMHNDHAAVFENLGGDATLIAPKSNQRNNGNHNAHFAHLASFVRSSQIPKEQKRAIWKLAMQAFMNLLQQKKASSSEKFNHKLWFSTSGLGVYWLHLRLDRYPKYYTYTPYKEM